MKNIFFLLFSMTLFNSCQTGAARTKHSVNYNIADTKFNIFYGTDSMQKMDIYLPAGRSEKLTKSIVLIHGGGWNAGSKNDFVSYIDTLRKRLPDYAIFNIDYRLATTKTIFPTQENDVKAAIDFIAANASEYGINKNLMSLLGASAGAHLALLQAYKYKDVKVRAVIDFFGPTDLVTMYNKPWHSMIPYLLHMLTGTTPAANLKAYKEASPVYYISPETPPTLILQGGNDQIVHPSQSRLLQEKLEKAGVKHELVIYTSQRHGWQGPVLTNSFDRIEKFLKANVK
jgi:acetyl esterase/lipase